jgi:phosphoribosylglycinamide formyltransferase-1
MSLDQQLFRVGFCVSGQGRLFRAAVENSKLLGIHPAIVVVEGQASPELESFSDSHGVELRRLSARSRADFDQELCDVCVHAQLDLLSLTFNKLLPASLVSHYRERIINVHPALLPSFKGMHALDQTSRSGVLFAGATIHEVDEEMDHGATIAQCVIGLQRSDTAEEIGRRVYPLLRCMFLQVLAWYAAGRVSKTPDGHIVVRDAVYGGLPISPAPELPGQEGC